VSAPAQLLPRGPAGVWSCGYPGCPVGLLTLALRFRPGCALPALACPLCRRPLRLRFWLRPAGQILNMEKPCGSISRGVTDM
jgi:hypothetical protein